MSLNRDYTVFHIKFPLIAFTIKFIFAELEKSLILIIHQKTFYHHKEYFQDLPARGYGRKIQPCDSYIAVSLRLIIGAYSTG